jgi:heme-degrading monooxygenase HmoA
MIVVQNRVPVAEGHEDAFIERFRARRGLVDGQPGFIRNMVLRPIPGERFSSSEPPFHIVLTFWESEEHFRAWTESEAFKAAHSRVLPREMFRGRAQLEIHEVVLDTAHD